MQRCTSVMSVTNARSHEICDKIHRFHVPPADAIEYHDMDSWQILAVTNPPVTIHSTDNELKDVIPDQISPSVLFFRYPCHTRAVERCVKLATKASAA